MNIQWSFLMVETAEDSWKRVWDSMLKIWIPKSLIELWASTQPEVKAIFISFFSKCFSKKKEMKIKDVVFFLVENFIDET